VNFKVDANSLRRTVQSIIGERNPFYAQRHLASVESFIERELNGYGLAVESDYFTYRGTKFRNIIGRLGSQRGPSCFILGAHFDAVPGTPGADDNASGVAVLLEAARLLARARLRSSVLCCAFNLEELNMVGSTHFAGKLKAAGANVTGMVSLEMVGYTDSRPGRQKYPLALKWFYPDRGDFIGVIGNWSSSSLLNKFAREMRQVRPLSVETLSVPGNGGLIPEVRLSDHSPFWDLGYPALLVTDTAFLRNPNYHGPTDTLETLDFEFMSKVCEGVIRGVAAVV
jgi:Zn-dependent M28 family amino/carboxypeptidase